MSRFKEISSFVAAVTRGSLSAAARAEGVTPAVIGRRLDALEARLGVRLVMRTTRRLTLTFEGEAFLEDCQRLLADLANAEAAVSLGSVRARGRLCLSAPAGFGRRHVAPLVDRYIQANPEVTVSLDLSDRLADLVNENIDCAIRIGELTDSSLVSARLGEVRRVVVASPAYLVAHGVPRLPAELANHNCLALDQQGGWLFRNPASGSVESWKVRGRFACNDGAVLHEWALAGRGLAWRSLWEVGKDLGEGRLVSVLDAWQAPPIGIFAVFPQRRHMPLRLRLFIDLVKDAYGRPEYWEL